MPTISPFTPQPGATKSITASTSSQNVVVSSGAGQQVRVLNTASLTVYVAFGSSTVTASTTTDMPILSTNVAGEKFTIPLNVVTYMAAIASVTTTTPVFVTPGEGF